MKSFCAIILLVAVAADPSIEFKKSGAADCALTYDGDKIHSDGCTLAATDPRFDDLETRVADLESNLIYTSCTDAYMKQQPSGFTPITVDGITMSVYCDQTTDGGGWEIFQRRASTSVDFYRGWNEYKDGFGDNANWWLGNTRINLLTTAGARTGNTELRVDLADGGDSRYAHYTNFQIGDASTKYQLSVSGYSGDAGDDMSGMSGYPFSTHDQDNDSWSSNCAEQFKGAWWYTSCHSSNLNAVYHNGAHVSHADGVNWHSFRGHYYSLTLSEMKTRIGGKPTSNCGMMQIFQSCTQAKQAGHGASGEFCIQPGSSGNSFKVQCDMTTDGGGWEVFQRRADGSVDFYNAWHTYVEGFGNSQEYWLGLDNIARLTGELRVDLWDGSDYRYAKYSSFSLTDASTKYQLSVSGYSGDAGDDMSGMNNYPFSTHDQDNDSWSSNCAEQFKGAWWYTSCHSSNLNAVYHNGAHVSHADGVNWHSFKGHYYALSRTEMKVRSGGIP